MSSNQFDDEYPGRMLQQAAIYNNIELMETLLEGPELRHINSQDLLGRTALYTSVTNNSFECCRLLLTAGGQFRLYHILYRKLAYCIHSMSFNSFPSTVILL